MKKLFTILSAWAVVSLLGLTQAGVQSTYAKGLSASSPVNTSAQAAPGGQETKAQTFDGTIAKAGEQYVLKSADATYTVDKQAEAAKFEGKAVKVTGTLDAPSNTIHVEKITAQ